MSTAVGLLQKLQNWYLQECNGDWEHSYGVKIDTLDNPGWMVTIDLHETRWEHLIIPRKITERSDMDWVQIEVTGGKFLGCGGPRNLEEVLALFFDLIV